MAFTADSKKAAADVLGNLAKHGDHLGYADKMGLLVTSLAIESDINRQTEALQYEKAQKTAELARITELLS